MKFSGIDVNAVTRMERKVLACQFHETLFEILKRRGRADIGILMRGIKFRIRSFHTQHDAFLNNLLPDVCEYGF